MLPDVTVLIPVRNGIDYLADAIRSVLVQSYPGIRLLISDNGSTDGTWELLDAYRDQSKVRTVRQQRSLSMLEHFNACLDLIDTPYYMLLCHDDFLASPDSIAVAHAILDDAHDVMGVYCDLRYVDEKATEIMVRRFGRSGPFDPRSAGRSSVIRARNLFGIPLLVRTRAVRGARYDLSLPYVADVDMSIRTACGGQLYHVPLPLIANRYHGTNSTAGLLTGVRQQMLRLASKHGMRLTVPEQFLLALNSSIASLAKATFFVYLRARKHVHARRA